MRILVVGAGLAGATLARRLAETGRFSIDVIERRAHVGGNCFTERQGGINVHRFGPHIFHSPTEAPRNFLEAFAEFVPYEHQVSGQLASGRLVDLPVNLQTMSEFAGEQLNAASARRWLESQRVPIEDPQDFREYLLATVGHNLFEGVYEAYTVKQWGVEAHKIPAKVAKRLPLYFSMKRSYHRSPFVAQPAHGFTPMFEKLFDHPRIHLQLNTEYEPSSRKGYDHTFFSGPIDGFFNWSEGRLGYRTVSWDSKWSAGSVLSGPQLNYLHASTPYTRAIEHKHLSPWEDHPHTLVSYEISRPTLENDEPFYPMRLEHDIRLLAKYTQRAERSKNVTFIGRLGTYRYLDMWQVVEEMLGLAKEIAHQTQDGASGLDLPSLFVGEGGGHK